MLANVAIDIESLVHLVRGAYPVHRELHTFVGAAGVGIATALLLVLARRVVRGRLAHRHPIVRSEGTPLGIVTGALAGALGHPVLDGIMHADIRPFQPFTDANPLRGLIGLGPLHLTCVATGVIGAWLVAMAYFRRSG